MDKRKSLPKNRLVKAKSGISKEGHSESTSKLIKIGISDSIKKSLPSSQTRLNKGKNILNKRTSETPKPKLDDFEVKRRSVPSNQENLENYYTSYIKALSEKLEKHKKMNEEMEEELKNMQENLCLEENNLKEEMEKLLSENKKAKKEKISLENELLEENLRVRREFEDFKLGIAGVVNDVVGLVQGFDGNWDKLSEDVSKKIADLVSADEGQGVRGSLKGTASFSNFASEVFSPKNSNNAGFKEAIVLYPFVASHEEEISLDVGDRVVLFANDHESTWWVGKILEKVGRFPKNCVMLD
jgi:hypothetical protein